MLKIDFMRAYKLCVETCMGVKTGENVLIMTDPENIDKAEALAAVSCMVNANPVILCQASSKKFAEEPGEMVFECMKKADVILVSLPFFYAAQFFHTRARKEALSAGARFAIVWVTPEIAGITHEEILETRMLSEKFAGLLTQAKKARVSTLKGTDISMSLEGRTSLMLSSLLTKPGDSGTIPDFAESAVAPVEGTAEGVVFIDGSMAGLGAVKDPIVWRVEKGKVVEMTGQQEAQKLKDMLKCADANAVHIAELGIGAVANRGVLGEPDDKKMLGTGHIAIGDNRFGGGNIVSDVHLDGVFLNMTLELDGKVVMRDGVLQI